MSFTDIYNYRRVCKQHFMEEHFSANKRNLNYGAVPTVNVCGIVEARAWSYKTSQDYQPSKMSFSAGARDIQQASTSAGTPSPPLTECVPLNVQAVGMSDADEIIHTPTGQHSKGTLRQLGVVRQIQLTPRKRTLYNQLSLMKKKMYAVSRQKLSFRKRLSLATKYNTRDMEKFTAHCSPTVQRFFESQLRLAGIKCKGRRFKFQEKVLALALFKHSGKAYRLLEQIFILPSRKTLSRHLDK